MEDYIKLLDTLIKSTKKMFDKMEDILFQSNIRDISTIQLLIIFKMEINKQYKVGELLNVYDNTNISYNLKSLEKNKYIVKTNNMIDLRHKMVSLTDKSIAIKKLFGEHLSIDTNNVGLKNLMNLIKC